MPADVFRHATADSLGFRACSVRDTLVHQELRGALGNDQITAFRVFEIE